MRASHRLNGKGGGAARITMEIYTHANMKDKRAAMESLQEVFA